MILVIVSYQHVVACGYSSRLVFRLVTASCLPAWPWSWMVGGLTRQARQIKSDTSTGGGWGRGGGRWRGGGWGGGGRGRGVKGRGLAGGRAAGWGN